MAVTSGFFNSQSHDRLYSAEEFASIFDGVISDGVFQTYPNGSTDGSFKVTPASSGLTVNVGIGRAWLNHTWTLNDAVLPVTLSNPHQTLDRIDCIVITVDKSDAIRANSIGVVTGTPASSPQPPTLAANQYCIAQVRVNHGASSFTTTDITDKRGLTRDNGGTPWVAGFISSTVTVDGLYSAWQSQFETWFANIQSQLDGDVAANLQNQINTINNSISIDQDVKTIYTNLGWEGFPEPT